MKQKHTDHYKLNGTALTYLQTATWQSKKQQCQTFIQTQEGLPNSGNILMVCGNKMPARCNRGFYCRSYCLLNMFRAPLCASSGAQEYYTVVAACGILCCGFSSSWSGVELRVMRLVCRMLPHPANRTHNPQLHTRPAT